MEQEAARDLVRAREDARGDLMRARHRLSKLLLRQGIVYSGGQAWTGAHDVWLRRTGRSSTRRRPRLTFESDYDAVLTVKARRDRLDAAIAAMAADCEFTPIVRRLGCLRGVGTLTGFALAVEIGDWDRFTGKTIGSFVGLVPSEYSSGQSRVQGSITKTGNSHVRRLLVEAAWHHRARYVGRQDHARPLGAGRPGRPGPRRRRQPAAAPPLGHVPSPAQAPRDRQRRHRPRTGRLVLVPGRARGVATHEPASSTTAGGSSARSDPRNSYEQPGPDGRRRSTLDTRSAPAEQPVLR